MAEAEQLLVAARTKEQVGIAALNLAMGSDTTGPTQVRDIQGEPSFDLPLDFCSELADENRREIQVAHDMIDVANWGKAAAKARFRPTLSTTGYYASLTGDVEEDVWSGNVTLVWDIYSGGSRGGKVRRQDALVREAMGRCRQICKKVTFEVNDAYCHTVAARQRITLSRTAVQAASERLRVVNNKFLVGKASSTDVVTAQTAMTRAQQQYYNALYGLRTAMARLEYAMGVSFAEAGQ